MMKVPKLRFKEFKGEWQKKKLGELVTDLYNGQTPSRNIDEYWQGNINWLSSGELNRGYITKTIEKISEKGKKDTNLRLIPKGLFIIAITGLEAAGTRGNCGIININTTVNQSCMAIYNDKNKLSTQFLFQWYKSVAEYYGIKYTQGTKQQSYNSEIIKGLIINLPFMNEQNRIANFLSTVDKKIENQQSIVASLEKQKKGLMQKIFSQQLRFRDDKGKDYPAWQKYVFKDVFEFLKNNSVSRDGLSESHNNGMCNIHYGDILTKLPTIISSRNDDLPVITDCEYIEKICKALEKDEDGEFAKSIFLQNGDIVIADTAEDYTAGKAVEVVDVDGKVLAGLHTLPCRPKLKFALGFLGYYLNSEKYHFPLMRLLVGTKVLSINKNEIAKTIVEVPCLEEQKKIADVLLAMDKKIEIEKDILNHWQMVKKGLLQQMFV